jgi:serine/threonine protein kinase
MTDWIRVKRGSRAWQGVGAVPAANLRYVWLIVHSAVEGCQAVPWLDCAPACLLKQGVKVDTSAPGAGGRFVPPSVEELRRQFPQLEILEQIGQGGMGAVYKARQPALDRLVALKILKLPTTADPGFAERFIREAKTLARLSHPRIVAVHDFGQVDGMAYLILEYVDGASLREIVRSGRLTPREALAIVPQICEALQFAHDDGVVHRDIKPENILVDRKGQVKITDFGIAKLLGRAPSDDWLTGDRDMVGTPLYMAPEQVERPQTVDHRADIYSLGVVFYELLTGELPLGRFAPPSAKVQLDVRLDEVVLRTLEKEPERRYQQAGQVKTDVETIATTTGRIGARPTMPGTSGARDWSRWLTWGLGGWPWSCYWLSCWCRHAKQSHPFRRATPSGSIPCHPWS